MSRGNRYMKLKYVTKHSDRSIVEQFRQIVTLIKLIKLSCQ
jgi:hypothetical protein